jgi:hypothetical protein
LTYEGPPAAKSPGHLTRKNLVGRLELTTPVKVDLIVNTGEGPIDTQIQFSIRIKDPKIKREATFQPRVKIF